MRFAANVDLYNAQRTFLAWTEKEKPYEWTPNRVNTRSCGYFPHRIVGNEARLLFWQIHAIRHGFTHQDMHLTAQKRAVEYDPLVGLKNGSGERRSCESRLRG
jgi:hypothetical protein